MSRSPSRNHASPPRSATVARAFQLSFAPAPAALLVRDAGEGVEDAVEVGGVVLEAEHLDVVGHVAYDADVAFFDDSDDTTEDVAPRRRPRGRLPSRGRPRPERREDAPCPWAEPAAKTLEVGGRIHVIDEIRRLDGPRGPERREPLRAPGAVDRREHGERRERECVGRAVGSRREGEPVVGDGACEREQIARGHAGQVSVHDEERPDSAGRERGGLEPCRTAAPCPPPGS